MYILVTFQPLDADCGRYERPWFRTRLFESGERGGVDPRNRRSDLVSLVETFLVWTRSSFRRFVVVAVGLLRCAELLRLANHYRQIPIVYEPFLLSQVPEQQSEWILQEKPAGSHTPPLSCRPRSWGRGMGWRFSLSAAAWTLAARRTRRQAAVRRMDMMFKVCKK